VNPTGRGHSDPLPAVSKVQAAADMGRVGQCFAAAFGAVLALSLLKFGNPIILDRLIDPPADIW